jgi:prepilin-type N-terminal cleavage/methylation domain-containing protein/prepilin-type processing-associated H-X9-DG protein
MVKLNGRLTVSSRVGFTLVELLVVIGIIAVLIGILLPTLGRAREAGNTVKCAANLRAVGQGITQYLADNKGGFPLAYTYTIGQFAAGPNSPDVGGGTAAEPVYGYVHWSSYIYGNGNGRTAAAAFTCPSFEDGGHPPTNPAPADRVNNQALDGAFNVAAAQWDRQAPRLAYTVNEAIMGRNKTNARVERSPGYAGAYNVYVKASEIRKPSETILATEMSRVLRYFDDGFTTDPDSTGTAALYKTHRPVNAFTYNGGSGGPVNLYTQSARGDVGLVNPAPPPPLTIVPDAIPSNNLWQVGRNHGTGKSAKTNFLYVDGHVETKTIEESLGYPRGSTRLQDLVVSQFQWGEKIWSIRDKPGVTFR